MKRYLLFFGNRRYPLGGMKDLIGMADTLEEGIEKFDEYILKDYTPKYDSFDNKEYLFLEWLYSWGHIYDTEMLEIVWEKKG